MTLLYSDVLFEGSTDDWYQRWILARNLSKLKRPCVFLYFHVRQIQHLQFNQFQLVG